MDGRAPRRRRRAGPLLPFPQRCQVTPRLLEGLEERCPMDVKFRHQILLDDGIGARSASCAPHLFEAAAGLLKAVMQAGVEPGRVKSINVTRVAFLRIE